MEEVGHAGTEDGDGKSQGPVRQGPVPPGTELQQQPDDEDEDLGAPAPDVAPRFQVVGGGLPTCGSEDLHHPEDEYDLWDLGRHRGREDLADQGEPAVREGPSAGHPRRAGVMASGPHVTVPFLCRALALEPGRWRGPGMVGTYPQSA